MAICNQSVQLAVTNFLRHRARQIIIVQIQISCEREQKREKKYEMVVLVKTVCDSVLQIALHFILFEIFVEGAVSIALK